MKLFFLLFHICFASIHPVFFTRRAVLYTTPTIYQITPVNTKYNNKTITVNAFYSTDYMTKLMELEKKRVDAEIKIQYDFES